MCCTLMLWSLCMMRRTALLYLVFFLGLCAGFVAAQQLYLRSAARATRPALQVLPALAPCRCL
jgi:hypothetical protein